LVDRPLNPVPEVPALGLVSKWVIIVQVERIAVVDMPATTSTSAAVVVVAAAAVIKVTGLGIPSANDYQLLDRFVTHIEQMLYELGVRMTVWNTPGQLGQGAVPGDRQHDG